LVNYQCVLIITLMKGVCTLNHQLSQLDLQNLRELIFSHELANKKLGDYVNQCSDPQVKKMVQQSSQEAGTTKQKLISFLH